MTANAFDRFVLTKTPEFPQNGEWRILTPQPRRDPVLPEFSRRLREARGKLSRTDVVRKLKRDCDIEITIEAVKKNENGHLPRPSTRAAYAKIYSKPEVEIFPQAAEI